jgi:hypothetical protein
MTAAPPPLAPDIASTRQDHGPVGGNCGRSPTEATMHNHAAYAGERHGVRMKMLESPIVTIFSPPEMK